MYFEFHDSKSLGAEYNMSCPLEDSRGIPEVSKCLRDYVLYSLPAISFLVLEINRSIASMRAIPQLTVLQVKERHDSKKGYISRRK